LILVCACSARHKNEVVAWVNFKPIYLAEFREQLEKNWMIKESNLTQMDYRLKLKCLEDMIKQKLILEEAERIGLQVPDQELKAEMDKMTIADSQDFKKSLEENGTTEQKWREQVRNDLLMRQTIDTVLAHQYFITEQEIEDYYQSHRQSFILPEQYQVQQILVVQEDKAKDVLRQLAAGGNFRDLAVKFSEGPEAAKGGELGWVEPAQLPPALQAQVVRLEPGRVSGLIKSPFGYHIIMVKSRKKSAELTLEEAKPLILNIIDEQKKNKLYQAWIQALWKKAKIKINYQVL